VPANLYGGQLDDAREAVRQLMAVLDRELDPFFLALTAGGAVTIHLDEPQTAARYATTALEVGAPLNNPTLDAWISWAEGCRSIATHHFDLARAQLEHSAALASETQNPHIEDMAELALALAAGITGSADAVTLYRDALTRFQAARDWMNLSVAIEQLAIYWFRTNDLEPAAVVLGYLDASGTRYAPVARRRLQAVTAIRAASAGELWMARGGQMTREAVVDFTLDRLRR
jgi:hypothetical protein